MPGPDGYGHAGPHYTTMTVEEIGALPVREHVERDAVLFLWVTGHKTRSVFDRYNIVSTG